MTKKRIRRIPAVAVSAILLAILSSSARSIAGEGVTKPSRQLAPSRVVYITDIEGKGKKWEEFLLENPALYRDHLGQIALRPGFTFVFGGDVVDKGPEGMQILSELLKLKQNPKYRDYVILVAGNRDINKLRLTHELSTEAMKVVPEKMVPWLKDHGGIDTPENRLKWILEKTMGAPDAFEFRRAELAKRQGLRSDQVPQITDQQVLASYQKELSPGGEFYDYIGQCQLMYRHGDTLYVHGGVTDENLGIVPGPPERKIDDVDEWIRELNRWYAEQVEQWRKRQSPGSGLRPAEDLIRYQEPIPGTRANQKSLVYGRYSDDIGNSYLPSEVTIRELKAMGIHRLVVGHTPNGDSPTILREDGFEIIIADNTFSPHATVVEVNGDQVRVKAKTRLAPQDNEQAPWHDVDMRWKLGDRLWMGERLPGEKTIIKGVTVDGHLIGFRVDPGFKVKQMALEHTSCLLRIWSRLQSMR